MSTLVGNLAPDFNVKAALNNSIVNEFSLRQYRGKNVILFFYPLDFTFVCPTELHAFQEQLQEFESRNAVVIGCSVDSVFSHLAWLNTPKTKGGIQGVAYPLISDLNKSISRNYGVLNEHEGIAYRGLFLIDTEGYVRQQVVNDLPLGRSVDDALRVLDAWIHYQTHGDVCPANWKTGERAMTPTQEGLEVFFNA
jgi:peroxiredoxin (alkyl hydroperoxide reductase subunit C)